VGGQTLLFTVMSLNVTRRITFTTCRCLGKSPSEAAEIADDVAISAASVVATAASIATLDPIGGIMGAGYIALEHGEAETRAKK
jgi:hypothetical protein